MANTSKTAPAAAKAAPAAAKAAPAAPAPAAPAPAAPQATRYTMGPWPTKHHSGNSIRAYMYKVAAQLTAQHNGGFTQAQYASALASGLAAWGASGGKVPTTGFGTATAPNGAAKTHAAWPCRLPAQGYLVIVTN